MKIETYVIKQEGNYTMVKIVVKQDNDIVIDTVERIIKYNSVDGEDDPTLQNLITQEKATVLAEYQKLDITTFIANKNETEKAVKKHDVISEINNKTIAIIDKGYLYNNKYYSASQNAQNRHMYVLNCISNNSFTGSYVISAKDETKTELTTLTEIENFCNNLLAFVEQTVKDGSVLKQSVLNYTAIEQLEAFTDSRTV